MGLSRVRSGVSFLLSAVALSLGACGGGGGEAARVVPPNFSACDQKPDVGASAILSNASQTDWVPSEIFAEKLYDRYDLEAVLDASSTSTTDYVQSLGVRLMKVPNASSGKACPTYFNLKPVDETFGAIWNKAASSAGGTGGQLAGLFFEYNGPTILVDEVSDRWTLVHELMHYNFNEGRRTNALLSRATLEGRLRQLSQDFVQATEDYKAAPNRGDLAKAVAAVHDIVVTARLAGITGPLEEMTIEAMLIARAASGDLRNMNFSEGALKSSLWYMEISASKYLDPYPKTASILETLKKEGEEKFWPEIAQQSDEALALITAYKKEVNDIMSNSRSLATKIKLTGTSRPTSNGRVGFLGSTSEDTDATMQMSNSASLEAIHNHLHSHDDGLQDLVGKTIEGLAFSETR